MGAVPGGAGGGVLAALCLLLLVWAPLPLASNRPWSAALLALGLFGLAALVGAVGEARRMIPADRPARLAAVLARAVLLWAVVQALPGLGASRPVWEGFETLTGRAPWGSLSETPVATAEGALRLAAYLTAAGLGAALLSDDAVGRRAVRALALWITVLSVYALADLATGSYRIGWIDKWIYQDVATGPFVNRNAWCVYAGIGAAAALLASGMASGPRGRWLWRGAGVVCLAGALFSESRWGLVSVAAGLSALGLVRPGRPPWRHLTVGALVLAVAPLGLVATGRARFLDRLDPAYVVGDLRWDLYRVTLEAVQAAPWTGYGLGSFPVLFHHIRDATLAEALVFQAHSVPLELMAELGVPAALGLMAAYGLLVVRAAWVARCTGAPMARLGAAAGIMAGGHALLDFSLQTPALAVTVLACLGAAGPLPSAPGCASAPAPSPGPAPRAPTPVPAP
ncbi:O-antigen ligase family protein [Roseospira marina]|uniref:O-antigen ligase family protein n=1 Tax=Roseospira marina TaxID=140057 RepID=A0A5M6IDF5_9PROT|nr:O-antigen ligase family protein [Roseospira marina]KAA5605765.1 O-antigen ligase family protein [Roseospira marina]MBB4313569.1 hypothetical protein [Roseospira marina]MBB5086731.1 hypothetical protein [Roseospira marina]